jgi:hypothetical protein
VTVPSELGLAGALKCWFRKANGTEQVAWSTVRSVLLGRPPARPVSDTPEGPYIYTHIGFDQRQVEARLAGRFQVVRRIGVPFRHLPIPFNNEVAFLCCLPTDTTPWKA